MSDQQFLDWRQVQQLPVEGTVVWTTPRHERLMRQELPSFELALHAPPASMPRIIAFGGGRFLDEVKLWRMSVNSPAWLCCVPSLWGSGSESSGISVCYRSGKKEPVVHPRLRPDSRSLLLSVCDQIPRDLAVWGMGDVWAHTLEAFMSPLASNEVRSQCAELMMRNLLPAGLTPSPFWFEFSRVACLLQENAAVGLVHALSHLLEPLTGMGHARLCCGLLSPVLQYNLTRSDKVRKLFESYDVDLVSVSHVTNELYRLSEIREVVPLIPEIWPSVVRHPFSRLNCCSVRPDSLGAFLEALKQND